MERMKCVILFGILVLLVTLLMVSTSTAQAQGGTLTPRAPIFIDGDSSFTSSNGVNGGGSGTADDPYIIENWTIDASGAHGILIRNTTKHFIIRNCLVKNGGDGYHGIYLDNVINVKIENNTCENNNYGIYLSSSMQDNAYPHPLFSSTPMIYDLRASNHPQDYLGNEIACELLSDWKHYRPITDRVNELTEGLTADYDKTVAIANWVKHSKEYLSSGVSVANRFGSVPDIFNADNGVCLDSSILTTAMLRLASIPTRSVYAMGTFHAYNEAYVGGKWTTVDATFGSGDAYIQGESEPSRPSILYTRYAYAENINLPFCQVSTEEDENWRWLYAFADNAYLYKRELVELPGIGYGTVILPLTSKTLYYDSATGELSSNENKEAVWMTPLLENQVIPGFYYHAYTSADWLEGMRRTGEPKVTGYAVFKLPVGNYRVYYGFTCTKSNISGFYETVAYVDFEISENKIVRILPENFKIATGGLSGWVYSEANPRCFNAFVEMIENLPAFDDVRSSNAFSNNACLNNRVGIGLDRSYNNTIEKNTCMNNSEYGIRMRGSFNNTIFHNSLFNNNAYDDCANDWSKNEEGNYWSDWQPLEHPDANGDGIVDQPRPILGGTNQDHYPLVLPNFAPNKPTNLQPSARQTTTNVAISCVATDNDNNTINVFFYDNSTKNNIDNICISSGATAQVTWSGLTRGNNYTFFARGQDNNGAWGDNSNTQSFKVNSLPTATNPMAQGQVNPVSLTTFTPTLGWTYSDNDNDVQAQYHIQVGTSVGDNSMWDNTASSSATSVTYAGAALTGGITYYWRVQVYDGYEWSSWAAGTFRIGSWNLIESWTETVSAPPQTPFPWELVGIIVVVLVILAISLYRKFKR